MKAIVTGAAGFIGSHLCERLLGGGWTVIGVDDFNDFYDPRIKRRNVNTCLQNKRFRLVEADIRDVAGINKIAGEGADVVVHLAARAGVRPSLEQPALYADVNINGTLTMLEAAKKNGIKKFVFASSSSVYGNNKKVPFSEEDNVDFPISPYAATKKAGELICHTYHHLYGISMTCLRYFTVYGPRQRPDLAIHKFACLIEQGKPIPVYGDGSMMRDFTYIDDIIDGTAAAINKCAGYNIYNLGESRPIKVNDLIEEIEKALGKKAVIEYLPLQPGDVERTYADVTKAGRDLGYSPNTDIGVGLERFVEWFKREKPGG
ncbi:MAG: NAD-dependent epimerase/dehydratase family protein [Sedimentisphaerales bacterium]|jgi:UDP-glucuronate 4-epimerase